MLKLLLCFYSRNDVPPVPQRNVSIAAERGAVRPSTSVKVFTLKFFMWWARRCQASYPVPVTGLVLL